MKCLLPLVLMLSGCGCTVVDPGNRGVKVHLGEVSPNAYPEGLAWHLPFVTSIESISIRQHTRELKADNYSSDLQQVIQNVKVLYRIPEDKVVVLYQKYQGDPWETLVEPRVQETMHELSALITAENIVKQREKIKSDALKLVKQKLGDLVTVDDIVIVNETLSKDLEAAIEQKMVQQQEASKAEFTKQKVAIEAETAVIKAKGEADAIRLRGAAIKDNPKLIELQMVEKWDSHTPLVVGAGMGTNFLLPLKHEDAK